MDHCHLQFIRNLFIGSPRVREGVLASESRDREMDRVRAGGQGRWSGRLGGVGRGGGRWRIGERRRVWEEEEGGNKGSRKGWRIVGGEKRRVRIRGEERGGRRGEGEIRGRRKI